MSDPFDEVADEYIHVECCERCQGQGMLLGIAGEYTCPACQGRRFVYKWTSYGVVHG